MSNVLVPGAPGPEQQDAPLSEQERKLLVRLFSDPTYFPIEFRTWIKTYLESSDIRLPSSAIVGGNQPKVNLPAGVILPFGGGGIPSNCKLCNGESLVRDEWDLLFQAIGVNWGAADSLHFSIPDLRDRTLYGAGTVVGLAATDGRGIGSRGGPRHHHYFGQTSDGGGGHGHGVSVSGSVSGVGDHSHLTRDDGTPTGAQGGTQTGASGSARYTVQDPRYSTAGAGGHGHSFSGSGSADGVGDHTHWVDGDTSGGYDQDVPSYAGINWIIATGKNV